MLARRILITLPLLTALLVGCASAPVVVDDRQPEALRALQRRFAEVVAWAHADPNHTWVHGVDGNVRMNEGEEGLRGYCYEWQELVFREIEPLARAWRWRASMIEINVGNILEHHAVLVHPVELGEPEEVLERRDPQAFVFDAWQNGQAEVYALGEWLTMPIFVLEGAAIE